jgi:hypothetical protein
LYKPTKTAFSQVFRLFILIARKIFVGGVQRFYQFEAKKSFSAPVDYGTRVASAIRPVRAAASLHRLTGAPEPRRRFTLSGRRVFR